MFQVLEGNAEFYRNLIGYFNDLLHYEERLGFYQKGSSSLSLEHSFTHQKNTSFKKSQISAIGDVFCELATHEVQQNANEAFYTFGEVHRQIGKNKVIVIF